MAISAATHLSSLGNFAKSLASPRSAISLLLVLAVALLVTPLPPLLIDIVLCLNLFFAIYLVLKTIFVRDSLELTTFPSLLLLTTVFRLSVSISTARSILSRGEAGDLIRTFGEFVVSGNVVVGIVIFAVISIVQFLVITKGGERIAEVSARFTLDSLPGRQMSIDADLKAGDITRQEAQARRKRLQSESDFFGTMDGAMRFVKGDCIATMLIVTVNLLGGILIGVGGKGLSFSVAMQTYSLLSIGDGLVAQIPSILSTLAAGILATRVNGDDASDMGLGGDIARQLLGERRSLLLSATFLGSLGLVPGFPAWTLTTLSLGIFGALFAASRAAHRNASKASRVSASVGSAADDAAIDLPSARFNDPIRIVAHPHTLDRLQELKLGNRLDARLKEVATECGCAIHAPKFYKEMEVPEGHVRVMLEGVKEHNLVFEQGADLSVLVERLMEVARSFSIEGFGVDDASEWLDSHAQTFPKLIASVQSQLPLQILAGVLRNTLRDGLSIAHPRALLQRLISELDTKFTVDELSDAARAVMVKQVIAKHSDDQGRLGLVEIADESLAALSARLLDIDITALSDFEERERTLASLAKRISVELLSLEKAHRHLLLVVPDELRAKISELLREHGFHRPVLGVSETDRISKPQIIGKIDLRPGDAP